jgi:hypothetical protein
MVLASLVAAAAAAVPARSTQMRVRLLPGDPPPTDDTLPTGTATTQQTIVFNGQVADPRTHPELAAELSELVADARRLADGPPGAATDHADTPEHNDDASKIRQTGCAASTTCSGKA